MPAAIAAATIPPLAAPLGRAAVSQWRREPFRIFFPLAVLLGWVGVGHWWLYTLGITATFSGFLHGQVMMQGFMMALAMGFLLTALPRRTQGPPLAWAAGLWLVGATVWLAFLGPRLLGLRR